MFICLVLHSSIHLLIQQLSLEPGSMIHADEQALVSTLKELTD